MVEFEDPITDETYDPIGDPSGTALKAVYAVMGISMTLLLVGLAQNTVLPTLSGLVEDLLGVDAGSSGESIVQFGEP